MIPAPNPNFDRIVVGVDGSSGSLRALEWACTMAGITGAEVLAVHGFEYMPMRGADTNDVLLAQARGDLDGHWTELLRLAEVPYRTRIETEDPRSLLIRVAGEEGADVIVVASRGQGPVKQLMLGSVASYLTHYAQVPVVVIPVDAELSAP